MGRCRRRIVIATSVLAVVLGTAVWQLWFPGRAFVSAVWRDKTRVDTGVRLAMADRLVARGTLQGKTRQEVVELLGETPPTGYFQEWDMVYWLGPERGFMGIDSEWLVLQFVDGRVHEYRIAHD
jgi:hypothetical protein